MNKTIQLKQQLGQDISLDVRQINPVEKGVTQPPGLIAIS